MVFELLQLFVGYSAVILSWTVHYVPPCAVFRYRACSRHNFVLKDHVQLHILDKRSVEARKNVK